MFRKVLIVIAAMAILFAAVPAGALAAGSPDIFVDGELIDDGGLSYISNGTTFVPLRAAAKALGAEKIKWKNGHACVSAPGLEITAKPNDYYFTANGRCIYIKDGIRLRNERVMLPVRQLCRVFGAAVRWSKEEKAVYITSGDKPIENGEDFYNSTDLYWLSRIIHAEASGESFEGKIAVGNVVLNRVESMLFPDSVHDVIFDKKYGIQFTPAYSGSLDRTPSDESVAAAKLALELTDIAGGSLYFATVSVASSSWAGRNCEYVTQIGNHCFYL